MTLHVKNIRKAVEVGYDSEIDGIVGETIDVDASSTDDSLEEVRSGLANDGKFVLTYPKDFTGSSSVRVRGSDSGEISGSITV